MKQRVITAIIALIIFIPILCYGSWALMLAAAVLAIIGIHEFYQMKYSNKRLPLQEGVAILAALSLILPVDQWIPQLPSRLMCFYLFVMILMVMTVFDQKVTTIDDIGFPVFVSLYTGLGFANLANARDAGLVVVLLALCIVWATDIGAYMIGKAIGKHKLAPSVSPNKTIEGSIGGVVCAVLVTCFFMWRYSSIFPYHLIPMILLTIFFSIAGQLGDLVESAYKRHYGVKDSGNILPGHGGILDRFDNLLFVFPIMHLVGLF